MDAVGVAFGLKIAKHKQDTGGMAAMCMVCFGDVSPVYGWKKEKMFLRGGQLGMFPLSIVDSSSSFDSNGCCGHPKNKLFAFVECRVPVFNDHGYLVSGILCCHASQLVAVANIPMILANMEPKVLKWKYGDMEAMQKYPFELFWTQLAFILRENKQCTVTMFLRMATNNLCYKSFPDD